MSDDRVYTLEIDGKPMLAFPASSFREAQSMLKEEWLLNDLRELKSKGAAVWDGKTKLVVRNADAAESGKFARESKRQHRRSADRLPGRICPERRVPRRADSAFCRLASQFTTRMLQCSNQTPSGALGLFPGRRGFPDRRSARAQTRTDDLEARALSAPLVDLLQTDKGDPELACAIGSSHRGGRLRIESRRLAHVHLRAEEACALARTGRRAARLHPIGRELRSGRRLVHARRAPRLRAAASGADRGEQSEDLLQLVLARTTPRAIAARCCRSAR